MPREYKDCEIEGFIADLSKFIDDEPIPFLSVWAGNHKMCRDTVWRWSKRKEGDTDKLRWPELAELIKAIKTKQRGGCLIGGLQRTCDPGMAKFVLINNHGMTDRIEHQGNPERPLEVKPHDPSEIAAAMRERVDNE
jgi:hypothetical protein